MNRPRRRGGVLLAVRSAVTPCTGRSLCAPARSTRLVLPTEDVLDPSIHRLLDADVDAALRRSPLGESPQLRTHPGGPAVPGAAGAARRKPASPMATRAVAAAAARAVMGACQGTASPRLHSRPEEAMPPARRLPPTPATAPDDTCMPGRAEADPTAGAGMNEVGGAHGGGLQAAASATGTGSGVDRSGGVGGEGPGHAACGLALGGASGPCGGSASDADAGGSLPPLSSPRVLPRVIKCAKCPLLLLSWRGYGPSV